MAERNMLGEGFIRNTLNAGGTVSGTQTVAIEEMNALIDGDFSTTAITVSGSFFISLDADLGARWKLNRIELYTDEPNSLNFDMSVSTDDVEYFPIEMTGAAGLWTGAVSGTTTSGAPRYLRYEQRGPADRVVQEWRAINDDTLVDFGPDGTQTEVEIEDAPIGKPSDSITQLTLFNKYDKAADGFIFIDETGNKGDDNFEISLSSTGPWFGRNTQVSNQPENLKWIQPDQSANTFGRRNTNVGSNWYVPTTIWGGLNNLDVLISLVVLSGTAYSRDFSTGTKGWVQNGFTSSNLDGGKLQGNSSTSVTPSFRLQQSQGDTASTSPDSAPAISNEFQPFRASDYDTAVITLTNPATIPILDWLEGPRLYWKTHTLKDSGFDFATKTHSVPSTTPGQLGNGKEQTFRFEMQNEPTWSGIVTALAVGPWTTATGIGLTGSMTSIEIFKDGIDKQDRLALEPELPISGSWIGINSGSTTSTFEWRVVVNTENPIKDKCLITSVSAPIRLSNAINSSGWFLCRFRDGFTYTDDARSVNVGSADPFEVKYTTMTAEFSSPAFRLLTQKPVYWYAEPGDMIGYAFNAFGGFAFNGPQFGYDENLATTTGGGLIATTFMDIDDGTAALELDMNNYTSWATTGRRPNVQFRSVPLSPYKGTGTYLTPVFDGGGDPALLQFEFDALTENGTSIDVDGNATLTTVDTRASSSPPQTQTALAFRKQQYMLGAHSSDTPSRFDPKYTSNYVIGLMNPEVEARENPPANSSGDTKIENIGSNAFYHEVNQELWVLNINISGTINTDARPIWDAYDISTDPPTYLRTQHMTGSIPYTFDNDSATNTSTIFEPVGWQADYDREEIYVITRENSFVIGSARYNGLIMTLDAEYKDVFWRNDQLTQDIVDAGLETNTTNADRWLLNMRTVVYRAPYFYALTAQTNNSDDGHRITLFRLGNNPSDPDNANDVEFIAQIDLDSVPGLPVTNETSPVDTMCYVSTNNLFYFIKDDTDDIYTFNAAITGDIPNESFVITAGPISQTSTNFFAEDALVEDYSASIAFPNLTPWTGSGQVQQLKRFMDLTYCKDRDSFIHMLAYRSNHTIQWTRSGQFNTFDGFFHFHNATVMMEYGADTLGAQVVSPGFPSRFDPLWGLTSGTLGFEQVAENSVLFPTGRYAQLKYQFNADPARQHTPYLNTSRVNQGIRVGDIPASGTKSIYLRTNIPEDETIGDQAGKLKVFWQLREC
jgi:hypothetical protein